MFSKSFVIGAAAVGLMLLIAPESQAQRGGHSGGHSGGHMSAGHGSVHMGSAAINRSGSAAHFSAGRNSFSQSAHVNNWNNNFHNNNFHNNNFHNNNFHNNNFHNNHFHNNRFFGIGPWWGLFWWPGYLGGGFYGGYYNSPYYDYGYPSYYDYMPLYGNGGYEPSYGNTPPAYTPPDYTPQAAVPVNTAHIQVFVPNPRTQVWFDGKLTTTGGLTRDFDTPQLTPGAKYSYTVRASWEEGGETVTREAVATFQMGSEILVDFNHNPPQVRPLR
jgi:uncharacterized protein (TIGR03000 family)